jgi:acetyl/propionyl-CoA carboxylase alpha subunit
MYFQAESNNIKYEINVNETREGWRVSLKADDSDWKHFTFSHNDYQYMDETISFLFKERSYLLDVTSSGVDYTVYTRGAFRTVKLYNEEKILHESLKGASAMGSTDKMNSEMPGKIVKVFVTPGQTVKAGDPLLIMEAMKMENELRASQETKIKSVHVKEGDTVETNTVLISFEK